MGTSKSFGIKVGAGGVITALICAFACSLLLMPLGKAMAFETASKGEVAQYASDLIVGVARTEDAQELFGFEIGEGDLSLGDPIAEYEKTELGAVDTGFRHWPVFQNGKILCFVVSLTGDDGESVYRITSSLVEEYEAAGSDASEVAVVSEGGHLRVVSIRALDNEVGAIMPESASRKSTSGNNLRNHAGLMPLDPDYSMALYQDYSSRDLADDMEGPAPSRLMTPYAAAATISPLMQVPKIPQTTLKNCWAACVASVGEYLTGTVKTVGSVESSVTSANHGSKAGIVSGLAQFTYPSSSTRISSIISDKTVSDGEIRQWVAHGVPIIAMLRGSSTAHAVVVCGCYTTDAGNLIAYVMEPQSGKYEMLTKSSLGILALYVDSASYPWSYGSVLLTGWQRPFGGKYWYFLKSTGAYTTGWYKDGSYWYHFNQTGQMSASAWVKDNGYWYYVNSAGVMQTGWTKVGGYWYYMNSSGAMQKGWVKLDGKWYYLRTATNTPASGPEGAMLASGTWTIGGKAYQFNSSGVCLNP